MTKFDGKGKFTQQDLSSLMALQPPVALLPKRAPMRFTPTVPAQKSFTIRTGHGSISSS